MHADYITHIKDLSPGDLITRDIFIEMCVVRIPDLPALESDYTLFIASDSDSDAETVYASVWPKNATIIKISV